MQSKPRLRSAVWMWSGRLWAIPLLCGGVGLLLAWGASEYLVAGVALAAGTGFMWRQARARAGRRRAALDVYAEREIARAAQSAQGRMNGSLAAVATLNYP
jgi:hypothetical protein